MGVCRLPNPKGLVKVLPSAQVRAASGLPCPQCTASSVNSHHVAVAWCPRPVMGRRAWTGLAAVHTQGHTACYERTKERCCRTPESTHSRTHNTIVQPAYGVHDRHKCSRGMWSRAHSHKRKCSLACVHTLTDTCMHEHACTQTKK